MTQGQIRRMRWPRPEQIRQKMVDREKDWCLLLSFCADAKEHH
jgi:hypothetical protein